MVTFPKGSKRIDEYVNYVYPSFGEMVNLPRKVWSESPQSNRPGYPPKKGAVGEHALEIKDYILKSLAFGLPVTSRDMWDIVGHVQMIISP